MAAVVDRLGMLQKHSQCFMFQALCCMQAGTAAVQATHLLRILAAFALAVLLQLAKATIYSSHSSSRWQDALIHLYDMPPVLLLTLVQLSSVGLVARQYKHLPSSVPPQVGSVTEHLHTIMLQMKGL